VECARVVEIGANINIIFSTGMATGWTYSLDGPETEALRHAWASCWYTQELGRSSAENWGHVHENNNPDCVDKVKDEANNYFGRELGSSSGDCYYKAKEAFVDGKLLY